MSATDRRWRWRLATTCAAAASVLPLALPAVAGGYSNGTFGLSPLPSSDGRLAPYFTLNLSPGHSATSIALVSNPGHTTEKLDISRSTGATAANGGTTFNQAFTRCSGVGCWITGVPGKVTLPPGMGEEIQFTVSVPRGTAPGQYLAGLTAEAAQKPKPIKIGSNGKATGQAIIIQQVTVAVAVTVGTLSELSTRFEIPDVYATVIGSTLRMNIELANTGQTFAHGTGVVSCLVAGKDRVFPFYASTVLPGERALIAANLTGLRSTGMTVPCSIRIAYARDLSAVWSGAVTLPATASASRAVHIGPGAYAVISPSGIPGWATALIVIGALLLAAAVVLIVRVRRRGHA